MIRTSDRVTPAPWRKWSERLVSLLHQQSEPSDNTPASNAAAGRNASLFLDALQACDYPPTQIVPSVVGGIGVIFRCGAKKAYVEFTNNGTVNALFSDGVSKPRLESVSPDEVAYARLIDDVKAYLHE